MGAMIRFFRPVRPGLAAVTLVVLLLASGCITGTSGRDLAAEYFSIGNAYYDLEQYARAAEYYLKALELDPTLRRSSYNLARAFLEGKRPDEAIPVLTELLEEDPENLKVLETLAYTYSLLGRMDESFEAYRRVLELSPYRIDTLYNAALVAQRMDRPDEAGVLLSRAYDLAPEDPDILLRYGLHLLATGASEPAIPLLEEYRKRKPEDPAGAMLLADAYEQEEYFGRALELYDAVIQKDSGNEDALFRKARILLTAADDAENGRKTLERAFGAGFADAAEIRALLDRPDLAPDPEVRDLLTERLEQLPPVPETDPAADAGATPAPSAPAE